jgi:hypothetical protein
MPTLRKENGRMSDQTTLSGKDLDKVLDMTCGLHDTQYAIKEIAGINFDLSPYRKVTVRGAFEHLPFKDGAFEKVIYDPPHTVDRRNTLWATCDPIDGLGPLFAAFPYGAYPNIAALRKSVEAGLCEGSRVLQDGGTLIFKWSDSEKSWGWAIDLIRKSCPELQLRRLKHLRTATGTKNFTFYAWYRKADDGKHRLQVNQVPEAIPLLHTRAGDKP